jgi:hypothetical protein
MQGPVIYHGASSGNGAWPGGGGGSASQLTRSVFFDAGQLVPYQDHIYSNPPRLVNNEMWAGIWWYSRAMAYDVSQFIPVSGRSFCSLAAALPANFDPAYPLNFRIAFQNSVVGLGFLTVNWEIQIATVRNLQTFSPASSWTSLATLLPAMPVPGFQWTAVVPVAANNALAPMQAGDLLNVFVSRAADGVTAEMYVFGVEMSYRILP